MTIKYMENNGTYHQVCHHVTLKPACSATETAENLGNRNVGQDKQIFLKSISALDKLLGQLGIYATLLSLIAYLQKQLHIFIFFYATFFFCDNTFSYCMKPSGMCLHIYSLPSSAFLKYQTSVFYCT